MLQSILGMSDQALADLADVANSNLNQIRSRCNDDWASRFAFAEDVLTKFSFQKPQFSTFLAATSKQSEFALNNAYLDSLLDWADGRTTNKEKGNALEDIASYLFTLIPGLVPRRNLLEQTLAFETDIVVRNLSPNRTLVADMLGRCFLVECKNWNNRLGVQDVGYFLYRMRLTHATFGVIFAKNGVTGQTKQTEAAHSLIRKAFHEDGSLCVVVDRNDLSRVSTGRLSFWSMLLDRMEGLRFGTERGGTPTSVRGDSPT